MSRFARSTLAAAVLALSATAASAQIYPLTNGPDGTGTNTVDSARGFTGINAVAPERELLYHPERAGNAAAIYGAGSFARREALEPEVAPVPRRARQPRRRDSAAVSRRAVARQARIERARRLGERLQAVR